MGCPTAAEAHAEPQSSGRTMVKPHPLKVDVHAHISPPKYTEVLRKEFPQFYDYLLKNCIPLYDMEE